MKKLFLISITALFSLATNAQNGAANVQDIGKALFNSMQTNEPMLAGKYFVTETELKAIKGANDDPNDMSILKFLAQGTTKKLHDQWDSTKAKLEAADAVWTNAGLPAVSHEPFKGKNGREYTILQVMFKSNNKLFAMSAVCVQVNNLWYIYDDIEPNAHPAYEK